MLNEPTTLAALTTAIAEAVETYGCDAPLLFRRAGLDIKKMQELGARYPFRSMIRLWTEARLETGDPGIGVVAAQRLKPQALHALGLSWLSSRTVLDGLKRLERYARIANTSLRLRLENDGSRAEFTAEVNAGGLQPTPEARECTLAVVVKLCRLITNSHFAPLLVEFEHERSSDVDYYIDYFQAPVLFSKGRNTLCFDLDAISQPAPAGYEELAQETDRIAERYLASLDPDRVQDRVREILLTLLPSGEAKQEAVAQTLHRSTSALQRQLKAEGASYRRVLDETRETMALELVREGRYSLGQIAYLLGFSDQANFSRAFKRWTGSSPTEYR